MARCVTPAWTAAEINFLKNQSKGAHLQLDLLTFDLLPDLRAAMKFIELNLGSVSQGTRPCLLRLGFHWSVPIYLSKLTCGPQLGIWSPIDLRALQKVPEV